MAMNKKAVFFTDMSLILLMLVFYSLNIRTSYSLRDKSYVIGERIKSVDFFIDDLEKDIQRGVYISMFRSVLGIQQYITSTGEFLNDTQETFKEILLNGTIDGSYISVMNQTELNVWIGKIQSEAGTVGITFNYTINDVRLYQKNPWVIAVDLNVTMHIIDMKNTASWSRDQVITSELNITTFEDPLYIKYTYGRIISTIKQTNITDFTTGTNTDNLLYHIDNSLYRNSTSAPSYIMRLSGNLSNSSFGIESIVNLKAFEDAALTIKDKSCIDYIYFSNNTPQAWFINETYNWLKLDNESNHLGMYEVEHLII